MSKDDMDKFEDHEMKKIRPIKRGWFDWLVKQRMMEKKKPKIIRDKLKDKIINDIWRLFDTEKEKRKKKKGKEDRKKKKQNEKMIKDNIIRVMSTLFELEK